MRRRPGIGGLQQQQSLQARLRVRPCARAPPRLRPADDTGHPLPPLAPVTPAQTQFRALGEETAAEQRAHLTVRMAEATREAAG